MDEIVIKIIAISGEARSNALMAIDQAIEDNIDQAEAMMARSHESLTAAHEYHTKLLTKEAQGDPIAINLLLIHASNILSNAEAAYDYAEKLIKVIKTKLHRA